MQWDDKKALFLINSVIELLVYANNQKSFAEVTLNTINGEDLNIIFSTFKSKVACMLVFKIT